MTREEKMHVAKTIISQLGGNRFIAMTGSKNLVGLNTDEYPFGGLRMGLAKNKTAANILTITLNGMDTYDMVFTSVRIGKQLSIKVVHEANGVYDDMLTEIFKNVTGLDTHL